VTQRFASQSRKLTFVSDKEYLASGYHLLDETVSASHLGPEFRGRIHSGVDLSTQGLLGRTEGRDNITEFRIPNEKEIHVAACVFVASREGAVDKRHSDEPG